MKPERRQREILSRLRAEQTELSVEKLAAVFHVSPLTVRRDLEQLEREDEILRTHGGCVMRGDGETIYHRKIALNFELKRAIGAAAAEEAHAGDTILINDGSTTFHLGSHLGGRGALIVYTNSIALVRELSRVPEIRLYVLGGEYDSRLQFLGGSITERMLEMLDFDSVFLGADAIDKSGRCLVPTPAEARLTQIMLRRGRRKYLLADHTKVGASSHAAFTQLRDFDFWLTTPGIGREQLRLFRKQTKVMEVRI